MMPGMKPGMAGGMGGGMEDKEAVVAALQQLIQLLSSAPDEPMEMEMEPGGELEVEAVSPEAESAEEEVLASAEEEIPMKKKKPMVG